MFIIVIYFFCLHGMIDVWLSRYSRRTALRRIIISGIVSSFYRCFRGIIGVNYEFTVKDWSKVHIKMIELIRGYGLFLLCESERALGLSDK